MNYEKKYKEHILNKLTPTDKSDELINKLNLNNVPKKKKMKKGLIFATSGLALAVVVGVGAYIALNNTTSNQSPSIVTLSVNPSIRFVLDKQNNVVSVTGENDEGKMIIAEEEIVGKPINEAIELVLTIENETGYLVSGNVTSDENNISVSITVDNEKVEETLKNSISSTVNNVCEKLNIDGHLSYAEAYSREQLENLAMNCDSTLTKEDVQSMTYEQLIDVVKLYGLETVSLYSKDLEDFYQQVKSYELTFAEQKFTKEVIANMSSIYSIFMESYQLVLDNLQDSIDYLNELNYNQFIDEEGPYQKALAELYDAKAELIDLKNELAQSDLQDNEAKEKLEAALNQQIAFLETKEEVFNSAKNAAESLINGAKNSINNALTAAIEFKDKLIFPEKIEEELNKKALELQTSLNNAKKQAFDDFESKYKDEILSAKERVLAYKQSLKDSIKNPVE